MASLTEDLVRLLRRPVPLSVQRLAALHLLDFVGAATAAGAQPEGRALCDYAAGYGPGRSWVPGVGRRDAPLAALINAGLGLTLEMDSTHRAAKLHPGPVVIAAALAIAERDKVSGPQLLAAIARGYEATVRVGLALGPGHYRLWHTTSTAGPFGAAAAVGDLIGLDDAQLVDALGNAGSRTGGVWQTREERAMAKPLHAGGAAQGGLYAAELASRGLTGPRRILEGDLGLFAAFCPDPDPTAIVADSEGPWKIEETSLKPWPGCRHVHPAVDAALNLRGKHPTLPAQLAAGSPKVVVTTYAEALEFADNPEPRGGQSAMFSLQHCVALALVKGAVELADFTKHQRLSDPAVVRVRELVSVASSDSLSSLYPQHWGARVFVDVPEGQMAHEVTDTLGDPERPMDPTRVTAKVDELLSAVDFDAGQRGRIQAAVMELPNGCVAALSAVLPVP